MARYYRKVIRIRAEDSPNVRLALAERANGLVPSGRMLVPGVLPWHDYVKRRATWDKIRQTIGLDAEFYEGAEVLLYPPDWLNRAHRIATELKTQRPIRRALGVGIDPGEGISNTSMCAVDEWGIIEIDSQKTPNTAVITRNALAFMRKHNVTPQKVIFDRGGGGKEHADRLREMGYAVRTVAFGETLILDPKRGMRMVEEKKEHMEERYAYYNRRAQMYGEFRLLLDPSAINAKGEPTKGFGIPYSSNSDEEDPYIRLRKELTPIPLMYDAEGRLKLPPKNKRNPNSQEVCLVDLIGFSPDEADSVVMAIHAMLHKVKKATAGVY